MKKSLTSIVTLAVVLGMVSVASAGLVNYDRKAKKAGLTPPATTVKPAAVKAPAPKVSVPAAVSSVPAWLKTPQAVQNELQQKSDMNGDGKLQTFETKMYLRDVIDSVNANGKVPADTNILKAYDANKDGMIEASELPKILEDVGK